MPTPLTDCQCKRWPDKPCNVRMTQEDLLCDVCRSRCSLVGFGPDWSAHVKITDWKSGLTLRRLRAGLARDRVRLGPNAGRRPLALMQHTLGVGADDVQRPGVVGVGPEDVQGDCVHGGHRSEEVV